MAHELLGVNTKIITDNTQQALIAFYMAKYIAKIDERKVKDDDRKCGRWWGKWNIVDPTPVECEITDREAERIVTFALGCRVGDSRWEPADRTLCTVFGSSMGGGEFGQYVGGYEAFTRSGGG
jgi:hypothetical protein